MMRQPARARVELAIGEPLVLEHDRGRIGRLAQPAPRTARARSRPGPRARCRSTPAGSCAARRRRECRCCRSAAPASATAASSSRTSRAAIASTVAALEQVAGVFQRCPSIPAGVPSAPRRSARLRTGRTWRWRWRPARTPPPARQARGRRLRVVLQHQHHLEQRMPRQRARRVEHLDQPLERQLLVAVGRKVARAHPRDQLAEARIARRVRAQHQRVDEEPDEIVERAVGAAGDRAADRNVVAAAQPGQQRRQRRLQHHEQARPARARELQQTRVQLRRQTRRRRCRRDGSTLRRPRPVARQLDLIGKPCERAGPERQLARDRALAILLRPQHRMLPQRVVGILHRQRRQPQAPARGSAPRRSGRDRAPAAPATSRRRQCDAAAAAARARLARRARTDERAAAARSRDRSRARAASASACGRAVALTAVTASCGRAASASRISCRGTPSVSGKIVRRLSCRPTRSPSAASSAARSSAPVEPQRQRDRVGRARALQPVQEPQPALRKGQRDLGRTRQRAQGRPRWPAHPPRRLTSAATVGASNRLRIASSTSSAERMRLISRVASSEWPPSSKKLSSMPTRSSPSTSANSAHSISSCGVRGSRRTCAGVRLRRRQRPAVELAVGRQRQPVQHHERRRHHVVRQARAEMRAQRRGIGARARGRHHIGHQPLVPGPSSRAITAACATPHAAPAPPRSRRARCGSRASSPARRRARGSPAPRRRASAPGRRCGTSGCPAGPNGSATNRSAVSPARPR